MDPASEKPASVAFGRFRVLQPRRELLADGQPVKLGGRAFDVLIALLGGRGRVVSRDELGLTARSRPRSLTRNIQLGSSPGLKTP
jgi:DNA-binding winged helix-turn-helix (wHTH) protein